MVDSRKPAAAGVFYPADREKLSQALKELIAAALATPRRQELPERPRALVVPHGIVGAAGLVAASAWARVGPESNHARVLLLGPSHHVPFAGMAAPFADAFTTPLGPVSVDRMAFESVRHFPQVVFNDLPHEQEPSLESQLPMLQTRLPAASIVPFVVGEIPDDEAAQVIDALWDDTTLAVVSTDLSRYFDAATATRLDEITARAIERMDAAPIGEQQACGHAALRALLIVARARKLRAVRLELRTSGTPGAEPEDVVGLGAFVLG